MSAVVKLHGKMLAFSRLSIMSGDINDIMSALQSYAQHLSKKTTPVLLDCEKSLDLKQLIDELWAVNIAVIGVIDGVLNEQAADLKLAVFPNDGKRIARLDDKKDKPSDLTAGSTAQSHSLSGATDAFDSSLSVDDALVDKPKTQGGDLICEQMIRSGQSVHHMGGDLIITASVNIGAEVATDYNLHIYGKGQGRLVAGATGDENARIFCQKFNPSLVSVAGAYCLKDDIPSEMINQAVEVRFSPDKGLIFSLMKG